MSNNSSTNKTKAGKNNLLITFFGELYFNQANGTSVSTRFSKLFFSQLQRYIRTKLKIPADEAQLKEFTSEFLIKIMFAMSKDSDLFWYGQYVTGSVNPAKVFLYINRAISHVAIKSQNTIARNTEISYQRSIAEHLRSFENEGLLRLNKNLIILDTAATGKYPVGKTGDFKPEAILHLGKFQVAALRKVVLYVLGNQLGGKASLTELTHAIEAVTGTQLSGFSVDQSVQAEGEDKDTEDRVNQLADPEAHEIGAELFVEEMYECFKNSADKKKIKYFLCAYYSHYRNEGYEQTAARLQSVKKSSVPNYIQKFYLIVQAQKILEGSRTDRTEILYRVIEKIRSDLLRSKEMSDEKFTN